MLQGLFNYDNPVWRFVGKLGDLILLNLLWIICCIPIFTIGASTTAVYYVTLRLVRDEDGQTIRCFFRSFKENFKQATILWLIVLVTGIVLGIDLYFFLQIMTGDSILRTVFTALIGALIILWIFTVSFLFPVQSRFYNPIKKTIFNAFYMSIRHFAQTIGMLIADVMLVFVSYLSLYYVPQISALVFLFGFPLIAFVNSYILNPIFNRYIPEEDRRVDDELRPILEDVKLVHPTSSPAPEPQPGPGSEQSVASEHGEFSEGGLQEDNAEGGGDGEE